MRNVLDKICREYQNAHFVFNNPFPKILPLLDHAEMYCRAGRATDDNMTHALCVLDSLGFKHTLRICSTYCFYTGTMVTRKRLMLRCAYIACLFMVYQFLFFHGMVLDYGF